MTILKITPSSNLILAVLSGVLTGIGLLNATPWLAWFMLIPLYYVVILCPEKATRYAAISGSISGLILFLWVVQSTNHYTGNFAYSIPLWLIGSAYYTLITVFTVWAFTKLSKRKQENKHSWWLNAILAGVIWVITDLLRTRMIPGIPWLDYQFTLTQIPFLPILQLASVTGVGGLTFLVVFINVLFAYIIIKRKYTLAWLPVALFLIITFFGMARLKLSELKKFKEGTKVALLCENIGAHERWSPETGDALAERFFELNRQAAEVSPDLIVWSESAIPWDFSYNDELLNMCLSITWPVKANHIIGILTPSETRKGKRYNSAYFIEPDGAITGRYDKVQLLSFIEKPFIGAKLPFFSESIYTDLLPGENRKLIDTPHGKAGVLICNEIISPLPYKEISKIGAHFFVVMSNNSWFEGKQLNQIHFLANRLRAVEAGLDLVVNCNRGISGIINAFGQIQVMDNNFTPLVLSGTIYKRGHTSFYARYGDWFIILSMLFLIIYLYKFFY